MSGGSYNYLYMQDAVEIGYEHLHRLRDMADRLEGLGAVMAAADTRRLVNHIEETSRLLPDELRAVWKAVEWVDSCDSVWGDVSAKVIGYTRPGGTR